MAHKETTYKVSVNGIVFFFTADELEAASLVQTAPNEFNLISNNRSVNTQITETSPGNKIQKIKLEGQTFTVSIKDELDQLVEQMGWGASRSKQMKEIRAPMPGLVLEIAVSGDQEVKEGDKILILEAMKMENTIITHVNAKIKKVAVAAGQAVEKGQVLVELE